jgi:hypothetical protein
MTESMFSISMFPDDPKPTEFNAQNIRKVWHKSEWHFSVIDIIAELLSSDHKKAKSYWSTLKERLKKEGNQTVTNCDQLKLLAPDGKHRLTDVVNTEQTLRLIQSIPSPKVEPFKIWLAEVGAEQFDDPEEQLHQVLERFGGKYRRQGKADSWIEARIQGIITRKQFVEALKAAVLNAPLSLYAQATDKLYLGLWDRTTAQLRGDLKLTERQNPRDYFGEYALIYTRLAEMIATDKLDKLEIVTLSMAIDILWAVAMLIHQQATATANALGIDLVTERPLLKDS